MRGCFSEYLRSCAISLALVVLLGLIGSITGWSLVGILLMPGYILASLVFLEGPHSDGLISGLIWFVLLFLINALLYTFPVLWLSRLVGRFYKKS